MKRFHNVHVLEYLSCLCWSESIRFSICFMSSTFLSHMAMVGGCVDFHCRGMHVFAASQRRTTDFLQMRSGVADACNRKTAGSSGIVRSVNFCAILHTDILFSKSLPSQGMTKICAGGFPFPPHNASKCQTLPGRICATVQVFYTTLSGVCSLSLGFWCKSRIYV